MELQQILIVSIRETTAKEIATQRAGSWDSGFIVAAKPSGVAQGLRQVGEGFRKVQGIRLCSRVKHWGARSFGQRVDMEPQYASGSNWPMCAPATRRGRR